MLDTLKILLRTAYEESSLWSAILAMVSIVLGVIGVTSKVLLASLSANVVLLVVLVAFAKRILSLHQKSSFDIFHVSNEKDGKDIYLDIKNVGEHQHIKDCLVYLIRVQEYGSTDVFRDYDRPLYTHKGDGVSRLKGEKAIFNLRSQNKKLHVAKLSDDGRIELMLEGYPDDRFLDDGNYVLTIRTDCEFQRQKNEKRLRIWSEGGGLKSSPEKGFDIS